MVILLNRFITYAHLILLTGLQVSANPDANRLFEDLLSGYNKLVRPVNANNETLEVKFKLRLSQLLDVVSVFDWIVLYFYCHLYKIILVSYNVGFSAREKPNNDNECLVATCEDLLKVLSLIFMSYNLMTMNVIFKKNYRKLSNNRPFE